VVTQAKSQLSDSRPGWSPRLNHPRFETWVVTQAKSSPIRDLGGHPGRIIPGVRLGWSPKPNHPRFETWVVTQAESSPIRDLGGHPSQITITRFETWVVTQGFKTHPGRIIPDLRLGWSPKPNHNYPIRDLGGHPGRIILGLRLGWSPKPNHPRFETWVVTQAESSPV
jgi:hypothetical protein